MEIFRGIIKIIKIRIIGVFMSFYKLEKNIFFYGKNNNISPAIGKECEKDSESLSYAFKNQVVNQELKNLRWRTYKIIQHSRGYQTHISVDPNSNKEIANVKKNKYSLNKIKLDNDDYPLEILFKNDIHTLTINETLNSLETDKPVNVEMLNSNSKGKTYLSVFRETPPNFKIEEYCTKLHIRKYNDNEKLIEFYVSKYPEAFNTKSTMFVNKVKNIMEREIRDNILDLKEVGFSSFQTLGCDDFNEFLYRIKKFDSIVEFNGSYIIKFIGEVIYENKYMLTDFIEKELEEKYNNLESKENDTLTFDNINQETND